MDILNKTAQEYPWKEYRLYIRQNPVDPFGTREFLDVCREDHELDCALSGKPSGEKEKYLKQYMGYDGPVSDKPSAKDTMKAHIHEIEHDLFYLWEYLSSEGLWSEAKEYLEEHKEDPIPFGWE